MSTFNSFAPIFWSSFLLGLLGPWWNYNKSLLHVVSALSPIINFIALTTYVAYGIGNFPPNDSKPFSKYLFYAINVSYMIIEPLVLCLCLVFRRRINQLFKFLEEIDQLLYDVNIQMDHSRIKWRNIGILVLFQGINVLQIVLSLYILPTDTFLSPTILFRLLYKQFFHQSFPILIIVVVKSIEWRFSALNAGMELICTIQLISGQREEEKKSALMFLRGVIRKPTKETLYKFAILHKKLCQTLPVIGRIFGIQVLCYVAVYFVLFLLMLYKIFETVNGGELSPRSIMDYIMLCKTVFFFILLIDASTNVKREAKHSAVIVHRIVNCNRLWEFRKQLDGFSLQIYHCNPRIKFVMIEFNWNLLSTLFSLATTYLFVLVQFNTWMKKKNSKA